MKFIYLKLKRNDRNKKNIYNYLFLNERKYTKIVFAEYINLTKTA